MEIQLPNAAAGHDVEVQLAMVGQSAYSSKGPKNERSELHQYLANGYWVDPKQLGKPPQAPGTIERPEDYLYSARDQHRLWQAWISMRTPFPVIEVEVKYPTAVQSRLNGRGYMFRIAPTRAGNEADREDNVSDGELPEDAELSKKTTQWLKLAVPK